MFPWLIIIGLALPLVYIWYHIVNRRKLELSEMIPGPKTVPVLGNLLNYLNKTPEDILPLLQGYHKKFGATYRIWVGPFHCAFFLSDAKDVEVLLSSNRVLKKNNLYETLIPWLGTGLLIADGKKWHSRRKIITPTFHFSILEQFLETFDKNGFKLIEKIKDKVKVGEGQVVDVYPFINACTLDIICETAMGIELNSMDEKNSDYVKAVVRISEIAALRFVKVWMRSDLVFSLFYKELKKDHDDCIKLMHTFTNNIIRQRRDKLMTSSSEKTTEDQVDSDIGIKKRQALLDVLLQSTIDGKSLTNEDIREEVDTFMFEGHDTTTTASCFALYEISKHPDVQEKIFQELQDVIGDRMNEGLSYSDLGEMKYLELVIKEVLRMYPPVPMFGRRTEEEVEINGKTFPRHCNVSVSPYIMGRNPDVFPEPEKFIPERFTKENMQDKNPFSFIVFSAGPRNCIGQKFAMNELKSLLSKVIYNFELYPSGVDLVLSTELVLRSKNGFKVGMRQRK